MTWTWTRSTALVMQHVSGQWTCMDAGVPIKSSVRHRKFSVNLQRLVRHRHSGIVVSPVPLVTDQSVSAQLCPCRMPMPQVYAECPRCMPMLLALAACPSHISLLNVLAACPRHMSMLRVHAACLYRLSMPLARPACPFRIVLYTGKRVWDAP